MLLFAVSAMAEEVTLKGKGVCAKCELKETDKCQNAIVVEKGGKKTTYYLVANDKSKAFHKNVCQGPAEHITATGEISDKDGKKWLTVSKIEVDK